MQIRVNLWDFLLLFGLVNQTAPDLVNIQNFQGIYLSPQQAKALLNVLQQNVTSMRQHSAKSSSSPRAGAGSRAVTSDDAARAARMSPAESAC